MPDLPKTIETASGTLKVGKRYNLQLWHGGKKDGTTPAFPPKELKRAKVIAFEADGVRFEAQTPDVTIGFLPEHVLEAKEVS